jgi:tetratricopeptide (TPR) repeat protein
MTLNSQLSELEASGLVQLISTQPDLEYIFRHILIQEAAYDSLLKSDRRQLHRAVGDVLERLYPERREELAAQLAVHFSEAGEAGRASVYFILAGDRAARGFANREAINLYTRALTQISGDSLDRIKVLQSRARIYEIVGEFDKAEKDLDSALHLARNAAQTHDEWQLLNDLGSLWAARDYSRTGEYYQQALKLADTMQTKESLAHSLNRVGNWLVNVEQSDEGLLSHQKALAIFKELSDPGGISETLDYLGMTCILRGEMNPAQEYLEQAIELYDQRGDRRGFIASTTTYSLLNANYQSEHFVMGDLTLAMGAGKAREAARLAHEIGWRPGEMWALCCQALIEGAMGEYDAALNAVQRTLEIGREIEHKQWTVMVHSTLGMLYTDLICLNRAQEALEIAVNLAKSLGSQHWIHVSSGNLACVYLALGKIDEAEAVLNASLGLDGPARTMGQRQVWSARVELALKRNEPQRALDYLDMMKTCSYNFVPETPILRLDLLEGRALCLMAETAIGDERLRWQNKAEIAFGHARRVAEQQGSLSQLWRIYKAESQLYRQIGRVDAAETENEKARKIIYNLAEKIGDSELKEDFIKHATE